jgi:hypothetical protein
MITKVAFGLTVLALSWIGILSAVMAVSGDAPAAFVPFPSAAFMASLSDQVAISDRFAFGIVLVSDDASFVTQLYQAGARLVLPAGLVGCGVSPA